MVQNSIQGVTNWDDLDLESRDWTNVDTETDITKSSSEEEYENLIKENKELRKEIMDLKNMALTRDFEIRQEMVENYTNIMKKLENEWKARMRDVEEQQEDILQWSIKQVEEYYKQKMANIRGRKRHRSDENDEEFDDDDRRKETLDSEMSHLTSKIVSMKDTIQELKKSNQILATEKNKVEFELTLTKDELKHAKSLLDAAQKDLSHDSETENYIKELLSQLSIKGEHVKKLKEFLNEAKEEYITITNDARTKEIQIKEQEELMVEYEEKIEELHEQLNRANYCLTEKTKTIETLEDNAQIMLDKITELENKILLSTKHEDISYKADVSNTSENNLTRKSLEDIVVKEELLLEEEMVSEEKKQIMNTKTDTPQDKSTCEENKDYEVTTEHNKSVITEDKSCQTYYFPAEPNTQEAIIQTSFIVPEQKEISIQTNGTVNYEEREEEFQRLKAKYDATEAEYKEAHTKVENDLKVITDLQKQIEKLDRNLNENQKEKKYLESLLEEKTRQEKELHQKLEEFNARDKDKCDEIAAIQKELKHMIQTRDTEEKLITTMEKEYKDTLRMLTDTKKALCCKEQEVSNLETRLKSFEQTTKFLELLQKDKEEQQSEKEKLREINEMLKESLAVKEREMEEFKKNRNETLNKYDNLIKCIQEDLERQKREVMRYQELFSRQTTPTPSKDECKKLQSRVEHLQEQIKYYESLKKKKDNEIISDDELIPGDCSSKKKGRKKNVSTSAQPEIIDLSGSEIKRDAKRTVLPPPSSELSEKKRGTRKKKLFATNDESMQDIEPVEINSTPSIPQRSLRSRRK